MRLLSSHYASRTLCAVATTTLLAGCAGGTTTAIAPKPDSMQRDLGQHHAGYYSCPATGSIAYVSDSNNSVINVYAGKFAGQTPCAQLTSNLLYPGGLFVDAVTHDLYVANRHNVRVFHRGQLTPFNTYTDPTSRQKLLDVTMASDGTIIASNVKEVSGPEKGSLSTWRSGPDGGTFVGNFPMTNDYEGMYVTAQRNGPIYYTDLDKTTGRGALWHVSCPAGACGTEMQVSAVSFQFPGGMVFDSTGDLLVTEESGGTADTFELPNPSPAKFQLQGYPMGMAISARDRHWFVADSDNNDAAEYAYPSGVLVGTVPGNANGYVVGIAVDP
jgi:DNA-binding beta-propeller fold protein YncE